MASSFTNVSAGVGAKAPTHSVKLTDVNGDTLGLILCDRQGRIDNRALNISAMPRTAMQMSTANAGYDDMELPFTTEIQNSWVGGRGQDSFSSDRTKYYDGYRIDTTREYPVCGPLEKIQTGIGNPDLDQDVESFYEYYFTAGPASPYYNFRVKATTGGTLAGISLNVHFVGDETPPATNQITLKYAIDITDLATESKLPSELSFTTLTLDADDYDEVAPWWEIVIPFNSSVTTGKCVNLIVGDFSHDIDIRYSITGGWGFLTEAGDYIFSSEDSKIIITGDDPADKIQSCAGDGVAWATTSEFGSIYGSLVYGSNFYAHFFEYKGALYAVVNDSNDAGAPRLYINGYRGVATSNASNLAVTRTSLAIDAALVDIEDKIILLTAGAGSTESQPWRKIKSNNGGVLSVTPTWYVGQDATTEFVILGCDHWTEITGHGLTKPVTDIAVINDYVVFAQGASTKMRAMQSYNSAGTWTTRYCTIDYYADLLEPGVMEDGTAILWKAVKSTSTVTRSRIGAWAVGTAAPTLFTFDVNYELRNDLKLKQDRLYASLWEDITNSNNDTLLQLTRQRDSLKVEATRLIGTGTPAVPTAGSYLAKANDSYTLANEDVIRATRDAEDLRLEAYRIIGDGTIASPTTYHDYSTGHQDSFLKMAVAAVTNSITDYQTLVRTYDDLTIEHNRILEDYALLAGSNPPLTSADTLIRTFDDLTLEHIRLLADYTGETDAEKKETIEEADQDNFIQRKRLAGSASTWSKTTMADVTFGAGNAIDDDEYFGANSAADGSDIKRAITNEKTIKELERRDADIWVEKTRLAGSNVSSYVYSPTSGFYIGTPTSITYANSTAHNAAFASSVAATGSDIAKALANSQAADNNVLELTNRITELIGDGSIATPGVIKVNNAGTDDSHIKKADADVTRAAAVYALATANKDDMKDKAINLVGAEATGTVASPTYISGTIQSELQRVAADIVTENARILRSAGTASDLMRQILDLQYQIVYTETESENNGTAEITTPALAAHTDLTVSVAHKYLKDSIVCGNTASRITGMVMYSEPQIPYIFKEDSLGSISDNVYAEIPIPSLKQVRSELNGRVSMQHGVYLYFNMAGGMVERYYDQKLDDIGPTRGEGLPRARQGDIAKMLAYPGRFYASIDAGFDGDSSILCFNEIGWHEIYRASTIGKSITDLHVQTIPGFDNADRMYFAEGSSIKVIPIAINPTKQYDYQYFGYDLGINVLPYIETSWIDFSLKDINKFFHSVTIFSDCTDTSRPKGTEYSIYVHYMVDNDRYWTLAGKGGAYAAQEIEFDQLHRVAGKRIKLKISMCSNTEAGETPRLKAVVVNGVLRMPVKRSYSMTFMLEPMKDLQDKPLTDDPASIYNKLHYWSNSKTHSTPLTMNTNDIITDNKVVFIDPASINTVQAASQMGEGSGQKEYRHIGQMVLYEV